MLKELSNFSRRTYQIYSPVSGQLLFCAESPQAADSVHAGIMAGIHVCGRISYVEDLIGSNPHRLGNMQSGIRLGFAGITAALADDLDKGDIRKASSYQFLAVKMTFVGVACEVREERSAGIPS